MFVSPRLRDLEDMVVTSHAMVISYWLLLDPNVFDAFIMVLVDGASLPPSHISGVWVNDSPHLVV